MKEKITIYGSIVIIYRLAPYKGSLGSMAYFFHETLLNGLALISLQAQARTWPRETDGSCCRQYCMERPQTYETLIFPSFYITRYFNFAAIKLNDCMCRCRYFPQHKNCPSDKQTCGLKWDNHTSYN